MHNAPSDHCCRNDSQSAPLTNNEHKQTICYIAGHSGGHIIPCLTLAQEEKNKHHNRILFITSTKSLDQKIINQNAIVDNHHMLAIPQQRQWYLLPWVAMSLCWAFFKSLFIFMRHRPLRVISTGSIIAIPGCIAAWFLRIPVELFEVNAKPGKTILLLARFASKIGVCFTQPKHYFRNVPCEIRPYPIRFAHHNLHSISPQFTHFNPHRFTIFIQGGSQGSTGINLLIRQIIETYPQLAVYMQVIHQTGNADISWHTWYAHHEIPAYVFSYEHDVSTYYQMADVILCRAGAGTLFEVLHFQKPCITIPLITSSTSHQLDNARAMATAYPELFFIIQPDKDALNHLGNTLTSLIRKTKDLKNYTISIR